MAALYVHRLGQLAQGNGSIAGEGVVVDALRKAGVAVMDPAKEPLADQLSRYAGARLLVFAEGSALHGRQLLGRIDQDILVINRRPGGTMAWAQIGPRCRQLTFAEVGRAFLCPVGADGTQLLQHGVTLANPAQLISAFAGHGIDLAQTLNAAMFAEAEKADLAIWWSAVQRLQNLDIAATRTAMQDILTTAGVDLTL